MAIYLPTERIALAVERLARSGARDRLNEYLILKRALVRGGDGVVTLSMKDEAYMGALEELTGRFLGDEARAEAAEFPYFNTFGTAGETEKGFRSKKYRSNGPADTVTGAAWSPVVERIPDAKPRKVRLKLGPNGSGHGAKLKTFFISDPNNKPSIEDAAVWYYRAADVSPWAVDSLDNTVRNLVAPFITALGLTADEREALFATQLTEESALAN